MRDLSVRLQEILHVLPAGENVLADVGCDHGKLLVAAIKADLAQRGIGIDISEKSLQKARILAEEEGVADRISFQCADGLQSIDSDVDIAIIAGLGANETVRIIECAARNVSTYVLCPHQDAHIVRKYLQKTEYGVEKDFIVEENGKYYPIILAKKNAGLRYRPGEFFLGKNLPNRKEYQKRNEWRWTYIRSLLQRSEKLSSKLMEEYQELTVWQKSLT